MKLEKWALIAEIVSGVAVVVTLLFLVFGIRENTSTTRASMFASSLESINENARTILADPDLSRIWDAHLARRTADLEGVDRARLGIIITMQARTYDTAYSMERYDLFGDSDWARFESAICFMYSLAVDADQPQSFHNITSDEFSEYIDSSCTQ